MKGGSIDPAPSTIIVRNYEVPEASKRIFRAMKEAIPDTISGINDILVPETEEPSKDPPPVSASRRDGKAVEETIS